jgi:hypothetical protein
LRGEEVSFFAVSNGATCAALGAAQDHKTIFDGDRGPNTGGMGAFTPTAPDTTATNGTTYFRNRRFRVHGANQRVTASIARAYRSGLGSGARAIGIERRPSRHTP